MRSDKIPKSEEIVKYYSTILKELLALERELAHSVGERMDKVIAWMVGFQLAVVGLLITNVDKLSNTYSEKQIAIIIIILTTSLLLGVASRILMSIAIKLNVDVQTAYLAGIQALDYPELSAKLKGDETPETIIYRLEHIFNQDVTSYNAPFTSDLKKKLESRYNELLDHHHKLAEACVEGFLTTMKNAHGYTDKEMTEIANQERIPINGKKFRRYDLISHTLYQFSIGIFGVAVIVFTTIYLMKVF